MRHSAQLRRYQCEFEVNPTGQTVGRHSIDQLYSPQTMKQILFLPLVALLAIGCFKSVGMQPVKVEGTAMLPGLKDGDRIVIDRRFNKLDRGDIVVFYPPFDETKSKSYLKRIIGVPGDTVEVREGKVFVNDQLIDEPYIDAKYNLSGRSMQSIKLDPDYYFVMGDNRDNSSDSRIWGPLKKELIYGKYTSKYYSAQ